MSINRSRDFGFGDQGPSPIELAPWAVISATTGSPTTGQGKQWIDQGTYYAGGGNGTSYAPHPIATEGRTGQVANGAANTGAGGGCGPSNGGSGVVIIAIPVL